MRAGEGYDYPEIRELVKRWGYTAYIKYRGQEEAERKAILYNEPAAAWLSERAHGSIGFVGCSFCGRRKRRITSRFRASRVRRCSFGPPRFSHRL